MPFIEAGETAIHYEVFGEGRPIVLVHGFASNLKEGWVKTGWVEALSPVRQVIAIDCRGHGESDKPKGPGAYSGDVLADDVIAVIDALRISRADIFGYSMGGGIALRLMATLPERFTSAIVSGVGERNDERLQALDGTRGGPEPRSMTERLALVTMPVLIVNGEDDYAVGNPDRLASTMPNATLIRIPDCDHVSVVSDQRFKDAVLDFLA
jgi:pimeloyl-ACP methyl ester carboxylesterase